MSHFDRNVKLHSKMITNFDFQNVNPKGKKTIPKRMHETTWRCMKQQPKASHVVALLITKWPSSLNDLCIWGIVIVPDKSEKRPFYPSLFPFTFLSPRLTHHHYTNTTCHHLRSNPKLPHITRVTSTTFLLHHHLIVQPPHRPNLNATPLPTSHVTPNTKFVCATPHWSNHHHVSWPLYPNTTTTPPSLGSCAPTNSRFPVY